MQNHEQLTHREVEREQTVPRTDTRSVLTTSQAEKLYASRIAMLRDIEKRLSPLMLKALEIKIAHEKEDLDELIRTEAAAEAEHVKRRGVLDSRFFRKKPLPTH